MFNHVIANKTYKAHQAREMSIWANYNLFLSNTKQIKRNFSFGDAENLKRIKQQIFFFQTFKNVFKAKHFGQFAGKNQNYRKYNSFRMSNLRIVLKAIEKNGEINESGKYFALILFLRNQNTNV